MQVTDIEERSPPWGSALGCPSPAGGRLKDWPGREITPMGINRDVVGLIKDNLTKCYSPKRTLLAVCRNQSVSTRPF